MMESDSSHVIGPIINISNDVDPSLCAYCGLDHIVPGANERIPHNSIVFEVWCADCERYYIAIMTLEKAYQWQHIFSSQVGDMVNSVKWLKK